jgi:UDP-glucuronate 4-epimerase
MEENGIIQKHKPSVIIHLAAHANVRKSKEYSEDFLCNNLATTQRLLQQIVELKKEERPLFVYASSSSIYGNIETPFKETVPITSVMSMYALSKYFCEQCVDFYCNEYDLKAIGLRFFSVYGPRCRPDMMTYQFLKSTINNNELLLNGDGSIQRDLTYIDDIVDGIYRAATKEEIKEKHTIYNLGNCHPISIREVIAKMQKITKKQIKIKYLPKNNNDALVTYADISKAVEELGYNPETNVEKGLKKTYDWMVLKEEEEARLVVEYHESRIITILQTITYFSCFLFIISYLFHVKKSIYSICKNMASFQGFQNIR